MVIMDINKDLIPYSFDLELSGKLYTFEIRYNKEYDFFTYDLSVQGEIILDGIKIMYGRNLFEGYGHLDTPREFIMPLQESDSIDRITFENLNENVFIWVVSV